MPAHPGSANHRAKLHEDDVLILFALRRRTNATVRDMAWHFKVAPSTITRVFQRRTWRHVDLHRIPDHIPTEVFQALAARLKRSHRAFYYENVVLFPKRKAS